MNNRSSSKAYIIEFPKIGMPDIGYISVSEHTKYLPFEVQRIFWTYYTPESIVRGRHAHYKTEQVLIAVSGRINVTVEMPDGNVEVHRLEDPHTGLYIPPNAWHTMQYSHSAVQLVLASLPYNEQDYIRSYEKFREIWKA